MNGIYRPIEHYLAKQDIIGAAGNGRDDAEDCSILTLQENI